MFAFRPLSVVLCLLSTPVASFAQEKSAKPPSENDTAALVEVIRTLAGQQLYQTYQNIDSFPELRFYGLREAGELARMLSLTVGSAAEADRQLERVAAMKGLSKEDAAAIARLRKIAGHLQEQGRWLQKFWDTGVEDNWKKAEEARKAAFKELEDVLELNTKKGIAPPPREPGKKKP